MVYSLERVPCDTDIDQTSIIRMTQIKISDTSTRESVISRYAAHVADDNINPPSSVRGAFACASTVRHRNAQKSTRLPSGNDADISRKSTTIFQDAMLVLKKGHCSCRTNGWCCSFGRRGISRASRLQFIESALRTIHFDVLANGCN